MNLARKLDHWRLLVWSAAWRFARREREMLGEDFEQAQDGVVLLSADDAGVEIRSPPVSPIHVRTAFFQKLETRR